MFSNEKTAHIEWKNIMALHNTFKISVKKKVIFVHF